MKVWVIRNMKSKRITTDPWRRLAVFSSERLATQEKDLLYANDTYEVVEAKLEGNDG